jgi:CHASE3 domain sensor protein
MPVLAALGAAIFFFLVWNFVTLRSRIDAAFTMLDELQAANRLAVTAIRLQLDEETGLRGYAIAHRVIFLQPYESANDSLDATLHDLRSALDAEGMTTASQDVRHAQLTSLEWRTTVAHPVLTESVKGKNLIANQVRGKILVDRFRRYMASASGRISARVVATRTNIDHSLRRLFAVDLTTLVGFGIIVVLALVRERSSARNAYLVRRLQEVYAPSSLPQPEGFSFSGWYSAASDGVNVGGDWYNALWLDEDRVLFVVGDVIGHGLDAAIAMTRARQSDLTLALTEHDPVEILAHTNRVLLRQGSIVTMLIGILSTSSRKIEYAIAGHPPPILVASNGAAMTLSPDALPLGVSDSVSFSRFSLVLEPGMRLIMYTDGLLEVNHDVIDGERVLLAAAESQSRYDGGDVAERMARGIVGTGAVRDDVAILALSCLRQAASLESLIPPDVEQKVPAVPPV